MKKNYFDLDGKVALITGASSGLGVQFAKALGNQGAKLALVARRKEKLENLKKELESLGYEVFIQQCDLSDFYSIPNVVEKIKEHYGTIDILVNNAGIAYGTPAMDMPNEEWINIMNVNLNSVYILSREVGKLMKEKGKGGRIINLGSIHSTVAMKPFSLTSYATTKGGILMLTKSLAAEWAKYGITVNAIGPSYFKSEMTDKLIDTPEFDQILKAYCPMERLGHPGELDGALIYFASDASSFTTGQLLQIDGGWTTI